VFKLIFGYLVICIPDINNFSCQKFVVINIFGLIYQYINKYNGRNKFPYIPYINSTILHVYNICGYHIYIYIWQSEDHATWYILIIKANEMYYLSNLFDKVLHMFQSSPLSIIRSISTLYICSRYLSCKFCWLSASVPSWPHQQTANRTSMTNTYCMYTALRYYWWWTVDFSATCRVLYQINLRNSVSFFFLL